MSGQFVKIGKDGDEDCEVVDFPNLGFLDGEIFVFLGYFEQVSSNPSFW